MFKKWLGVICSTVALLLLATGCTQSTQTEGDQVVGATTVSTVQEIKTETKVPKYVFMFIGDGMSQVQVNAAQVYLGNNTSGEVALNQLNFTKFPVAGLVTTQDSTSFAPDSASTATALSSGVKTHSGVIGLDASKAIVPQSITEKMKANGKKVGIVTSVTINHATPAAYYAHVASRGDYYDIATQMATSNFDYFAGGSISQPRGKNEDQKDAYELLKENGYTIANTKEAILALDGTIDKVYVESPVVQDGGAMPYAIDANEGDLTLADFVQKGVEVLDNEKGFFMMVESGKIDWACHANDAMSAISEVLGFESAVQVAIDFLNEHPDETLILVTGDHETGGMSIGDAKTGYKTAFQMLNSQKMSYIEFDYLVEEMMISQPNLTFEQMLPVIKENFGLMLRTDVDADKKENQLLVLTDYELEKLKAGFHQALKSKEEQIENEETDLLYGGYNPLSVSLTHILNNKAGIGWTSYAHTGTPVAIHAMGVGADTFGGYYDNTDVFYRLVKICDLD